MGEKRYFKHYVDIVPISLIWNFQLHSPGGEFSSYISQLLTVLTLLFYVREKTKK